MSTFRLRRLAGGTAVALDTVVLRVGWVPPTQLSAHLTHPRLWVDAVGTDGATIELTRAGLGLVGVWLAVAMIAVLASRLPGVAGRVADGVAGRAVPAVLRRAMAAALGASVVLVPVAAGASTNGTHGGARAVTSVTTGGRAGPTSGPGATQLSGGLPWPTSAPTTAPRPTPSTRSTSRSASATPAKPIPWPRSPDPAPPARPAPSAPTPRSASGDVVVRTGDCLWAIAAQRLGPDPSAHRIASETRRWYEANAATIGSDPGLIHPGQQLHQPTEKGR
jgi:hypothetical protein